MPLYILALLFIGILLLGYRLYGRFIAGFFRLDPASTTPAYRLGDGVDFVPAKPFYLFGQHFSAIAAAGPIAGPILASQQFGWLPCLLWIGLGVIFIGAVHDFSSLIASVRHGGRSIAEMIRENIGRRAWLASLAFIWLCLVYVIVAFTDITASTFVGRIEELEGVRVAFERGGAVAASSSFYLLLAFAMGLVQRVFRLPLWLMTLIFVPATFLMIPLGISLSDHFILQRESWAYLILLYCFVTSILPVWSLLQPRGYLGGFVLYAVLAVGLIGLFFGPYDIQQEAFKTFNTGLPTGSLFPFLFVTIACGACSGFHGLVCSGTTSKQIANETHCRPVGYGAMLMEGLVAFIALATIMILVPGEVVESPGTIYGQGIGRFLTLIVGEENLLMAVVFGAMAFSTFVFDTLDVSTRLGRYILQELFGATGFAASVLATLATVGLPALLIAVAREGGWSLFWVLFGTSNQLLAALTLLGVTVWLRKTGRRSWFVFLPMVFVMTITFWSLAKHITTTASIIGGSGFVLTVPIINGIAALILTILALFVLWEARDIMKGRA